MESKMPRTSDNRDEAEPQDGRLPTTAGGTRNSEEHPQETGVAVKRVREVDDLIQDDNAALGEGLDLNPS
jgi:hypothetical protein